MALYLLATATAAAAAASIRSSSSDSSSSTRSSRVYAASSCCGAHPELCLPLSPQPGPQSEVVAFHAPGMYGANADSWRTYDFDKLTGIGMFTGIDPELLCQAL